VAKSSKTPIKVAVTGAGALLGQGVLQALRHSSLTVHTIAVDISALSAGLFWADQRHLIPMASAPDFGDAIRRLIEKTRPDVLLVGTDIELPPLAAARQSLEEEFGTRVLVSSPRVVAIADDKYATARFFLEKGFPAPMSARAADADEVKRVVDAVGFPLIVKPRVGARSYGVSKVNNVAELQRAMEQTRDAVVQEYVDDREGEFTASGLYFDGRCDAAIVMRRDLRDGNTYRAYTMPDSSHLASVRAWTEALQPHGPANFQFRVDRDGNAKVFEINARFSGTTPLRAHAGFNEVEMCLSKLLFDQPIVQPSVKPIVILRHWSETVVEAAEIGSVAKI
jgi:carbamoyl-phosphate synthase large subunit